MSELALPDGPFTLASLADNALSSAELRRSVGAGTIRRVINGVYVHSAVPDSVELRTAALHLVTDGQQVIVDRTAAWLHGIDTYSAAELEAGPAVEACALRGTTRTRRDGTR